MSDMPKEIWVIPHSQYDETGVHHAVEEYTPSFVRYTRADTIASDGDALEAFELLRKGEIINRGGKYFAIEYLKWEKGMTLLSARLTEAKANEAAVRGLGDPPIGKWLSAALDDDGVCKEMKDDIRSWFKALETHADTIKRCGG